LAEIAEQKVDALQDEFESITTLDDEKQEVDVIRNVPETQTDLDQMLSSEVQDTGREPGASGDKKPTQDGMVSTLYAFSSISLSMLCFLFCKLQG
jgi:antiviral helicase SKI2